LFAVLQDARLAAIFQNPCNVIFSVVFVLLNDVMGHPFEDSSNSRINFFQNFGTKTEIRSTPYVGNLLVYVRDIKQFDEMAASSMHAMWKSLSRPKQVWISLGTTVGVYAVAYPWSESSDTNTDKDSPTAHQERKPSIGQAFLFAPIRAICEPLLLQHQGSSLRRHQTIQQMEKTATKASLKEHYDVNWSNPLGEGSFGSVHTAIERKTGEVVAVKKISKEYTDNVSFQREMDALLHIRQSGGHPNICGLRENYDEGQYYYLVLDYVSGGEMFDHLCVQGPYSEADAARLIQETASALAYLHGIQIVHGDIKPENLMLSSKQSSDAIIKLVDFGCAQVTHGDDVTKRLRYNGSDLNKGVPRTPAYCPPEVLEAIRKNDGGRIEPPFDMWVSSVMCFRYS
jgi:Protein kinase domain